MKNQEIPTGYEPLPDRTVWTFAQMKPFANGEGYNDSSYERGSFPTSDSHDFADKELTNLQWLQIAARNASNINGNVIATSNEEFLSSDAVAHNRAYLKGDTSIKQELGDLIYAVVVYGVSEEEFNNALLNFDPLDNRIEI